MKDQKVNDSMYIVQMTRLGWKCATRTSSLAGLPISRSFGQRTKKQAGSGSLSQGNSRERSSSMAVKDDSKVKA